MNILSLAKETKYFQFLLCFKTYAFCPIMFIDNNYHYGKLPVASHKNQLQSEIVRSAAPIVEFLLGQVLMKIPYIQESNLQRKELEHSKYYDLGKCSRSSLFFNF